MVTKAPSSELSTTVRPSRTLTTLLGLVVIFGTSSLLLAAGRETISTEWKSPVNLPVCLAMSPDGQYFGTVDSDGTVRFFDKKGHLLWKRQVEGATDVLIAKNGLMLLVYAKSNPEQQDVCFFRKDGRRLWKHNVGSSLWSGAVSADGSHAAVTTAERYIYLYTLDPARPRYRRWRLDGTGYCVTFTPNSQRVVIGTSRESALVCYDIRGRFQWRSKYEADDLQYGLDISADGRRILGVLPATQDDPGIEMCLWESGGHLLWKNPLDGFDPRALVSPQSRYVAVSYARFLSREGSGIIEHKVAVYGSDGDPLWAKGGLFFGPRLVALSPTGSSVIVSDGERSLYNMDKRGKILSKLTLSGTIRRTLSSEDGRRILLYCGDGWLYLLHVG